MSLEKVVWLIFLLTNSSVFAAASDGKKLIEVAGVDRSQIICTITLLQKYFQYSEPLSGAVISMSITSASLNIQQDLLSAMHAQTDVLWTIAVRKPHQSSSTNDAFVATSMHEKPQCYFVVVETLQDYDLEDVCEDWKSSINWNPIAQFVVYLASSEESEEQMTELMMEILMSLMSKKIYNVNVIGRNQGNGYFYGKTVFPYHPDNNCGNRVVAIETLDVCDFQDNVEADDDFEGDKYGDGDDGVGDYGNRDSRQDYRDYNGLVDTKDIDTNGSVDEDGDEENEYIEEIEGKVVETGERFESIEVERVGVAEMGEVEEKEEEYKRKSYRKRGWEDEEMSDGKYQVKAPEEIRDEKEQRVKGKTEGRQDKKEEEQRKQKGKEMEEVKLEEVEVEENSGGNRYEFNDRRVAERRKLYENGEKVAGNELANQQEAEYPNLRWNRGGNGNEDGKRKVKNGQDEIGDNGRCSVHPTENGKEVEVNESEKHTSEREKKSIYSGCNEIPKAEIENPKKIMIETQQTTETIPKPNSFASRVNKKRFGEVLKKSTSKTQSPRHKMAKLKHPKLAFYTQFDSKNISTGNIYVHEFSRGLFFDKIPKDLSGCPVVAAYRPLEPYIFKESNEESAADLEHQDLSSVDSPEYSVSASDNDDYDYYANEKMKPSPDADMDDKPAVKLNGIEYQLLQTISELLHITIDFQLENNNIYQLFQQLIDGDIEMLLGGIDEDPSISQIISSTIPYHQDDLTWCVAKAKRKYDTFNFLRSFHISTWLFTLGFIFVSALNICMAQRLLRIRLRQFGGFLVTFVRILGIILSQSTYLTRLPGSLHITFGSAFFLGLMFANIYQSFLVSTLTTPKSSHQISHLDEIYRYGMAVTGSPDNVQHLNKVGETFKYIRQNFQMCYNIEECLKRAAADEHLAVAVSREYSIYNTRIPHDQLYCFDRNENLYVYLVTILLPKKYHLLHKINPIIQYVIESGHMQKWTRELKFKHKIDKEMHRTKKQPVVGLTISQIGGSFTLNSIILTAIFLVFLLECWTHWMVVERRTRLRLVKLLHRIFGEM